jgi:hypothetical protein
MEIMLRAFEPCPHVVDEIIGQGGHMDYWEETALAAIIWIGPRLYLLKDGKRHAKQKQIC